MHKILFMATAKPMANVTGGKRARTRAAILKAAGDLIREVGYEHATLEAIAARAGMTRGAIYGNFKDRSDLFAQVAFERWTPVAPDFVPGTTFREHMRRAGRSYYRAAKERAPVAVHAASFVLQTRKHRALQKRIAAQAREIIRRTATELSRLYPETELPMPAVQLIKVLGALGEGLMSAFFTDPEFYDEALFIAAFEAIAGGGGKDRTGL
jgi:AcrR family transcriptional regulator